MEEKIKNPCTIYLVRHGETDWNVKKKLQGQKDIPLNKTGFKQAKQAAKRFKNIKFNAAYSSDLSRAVKTAEIIALEHQLIVKTHQALRERSFGQYEGMSAKKFRQALKDVLEKANKLSYEEKIKFDFGGGIEKIHQSTIRFITFLRGIAIAHPGQTILVITHGGVIRHFLIHIGFAPENKIPWGFSDNTAHIKLFSDGIEFKVLETNGVHLNEN